MFLVYNFAFVVAVTFVFYFFEFDVKNRTKTVEPPAKIGEIEFPKFEADTDRLIFIVIDALRYDFVNLENMPLTVNSANANGCIFTVKTHMPTVTLPRIKSLTVGNVPQFADIILNLAQTNTIADSILHRAKQKSLKSVFYGDDTWLKLYPTEFTRSEGVSSFFVNDFYEVDDNVTKNLRMELKNDDWHMMFLHYLGLDHIGHVFGPFSKLIKPKLEEMDGIINEIIESFKNRREKTIIMITGDHGMKDSGGHGGSTLQEIVVPLIVIGSQCNATKIDQTDIPVTLSYLMSTHLPSLSSGKLITTFENFKIDKILFMLRYNLLTIGGDLSKSFSKANDSHYAYLKFNKNTDAVLAKLFYEQCFEELEIKSNFTNNRETILIALTTLSAIIVLFVTIRFLLIFYNYLNITPEFIFIVVLTLLQPLTFFSSSFVEEEHQIWYFYGASGFTLLLYYLYECKKLRRIIFGSILVLIFVFIKKLNQTGDKWAFMPDLQDWFSQNSNLYLQMYILISFFSICYACHKAFEVDKASLIFVILIFINISLFHLLKLMYIAKICWVLILVFTFSIVLKFSSNKFILLWIIITSLLLQSHNLLLLPFNISCSLFIWKFNVGKNFYFPILGNLWLGKILYFCQGHSNSISNINIAVGYIGLDYYEPVLVGLLIAIHMYTFPILSLMLSLKNILVQTNEKDYVNCVFNVYFSYRMYCITINIISCFVQKHHLFIWTVFSPKLLIEMFHCLVLYIIYCIYCCSSLLQSLCTKRN